MANYILGGVMDAEAFIRDERGQLPHYFTAKTLTDSTVNLSVSSEEIRGGNGAQLLGRFFHTSNMSVNLTDALFDMNYLAAQIGSMVEEKAAEIIKKENLTFTKSGEKLVADKPSDIISLFDRGICTTEGKDVIAWLKGCDGGDVTLTVNENGELVISEEDVQSHGLSAGQLCVSYPVQKPSRQVLVKAMYYPREFSLVLTGNLFAGNACSVSNSTKVGKLVIKIPRFQLDGTVDLGLNMSSAATIALNGFALASGCGCDDEPQYATMSEVLDTDLYQGYTAISILGSGSLKAGDEVLIYAIGSKKMPRRYYGTFTATYDEAGEESTTVKKNAVEDGKIVAAAAGKAVTVTVNQEGSEVNGKQATFTVLNR